MDIKKMIPVVSIASVIVMFIWYFIEGSWNHCWIAVIIGAFVMAVLSAVASEKKNWKRWSGAAGIGSLLIMFIWAFIEGSYDHAWIACMFGGLAIVIFGMLDKNSRE